MLKKKGKGVIRLGDATSHGGKVINVAQTAADMEIPVACLGDLTSYPKDK